MSKHLEGRVAVVTGSGQGVGRGIAVFLAREGAKVITNNRKPGGVDCEQGGMTEEEYKKYLSLRGDAAATARIIAQEGGEAAPFFGDVSDHRTAKRLVEYAVDTYGRLDILVNNAAGLGQGTILDTEEADWEYMTAAKLKGAYNTMHYAVPVMIRQGFGRILNCASDAWTGIPNLCAYSAANAGVVGLTKAVAGETAAYHITANVYCPQADSPGHVAEFGQTMRSIEKKLGHKTAPDSEKMVQVQADHGAAEDAAPFLAYLCTEDAESINGSVFSVTASGRIEIYSEPVRNREIWKKSSPWTVEELKKAVPEKLLVDYQSPVKINKWQKQTDERS